MNVDSHKSQFYCVFIFILIFQIGIYVGSNNSHNFIGLNTTQPNSLINDQHNLDIEHKLERSENSIPKYNGDSAPLDIHNDSDLLNFSQEFDWGGNGSQENPFIIELLSFNLIDPQHSAISISNTSLNVIIRNNIISGGKYGIEIKNNATNISILNNSIHQTNSAAIRVFNATSNIGLNTIKNANSTGIELYYSQNCNLYNNSIEKIAGNGIKVLNTSGNQKILRNNIISYCSEYAIVHEYTSGTQIIGNVLLHNSAGLNFIKSSQINFESNTIFNSSIFQPDGNDYNITKNNFLSFGNRRINVNHPNLLFQENHWDNFFEPDLNQDGFIDFPYNQCFIENFYRYSDNKPKKTMYLVPESHFIVPSILSSNRMIGSNVTSINFTWNKAQDSWGYSILKQSMYFSSDNGNSWVLLANNISQLSFYLEKFVLSDGFYLFQLRCENPFGESVNSNILDFFIKNHLSMIEFIIPNKLSSFHNDELIRWTMPIESFYEIILFDIYFSPDNGKSWFLMFGNLSQNNIYMENEMFKDLGPIHFHARLMVIAKNNINSTSMAISEVFIYSPYISYVDLIIFSIKLLFSGIGLVALIGIIGTVKWHDFFLKNSFFYQIFETSNFQISKFKNRIILLSIFEIILFILCIPEFRNIYNTFFILKEYSIIFLIILLLIYFSYIFRIAIKKYKKKEMLIFNNLDNLINSSKGSDLKNPIFYFQAYCVNAWYHKKYIGSDKKPRKNIPHVQMIYLNYRRALEILSLINPIHLDKESAKYFGENLEKIVKTIETDKNSELTSIISESKLNEIRLSISIELITELITAAEILKNVLPEAKLKYGTTNTNQKRRSRIQTHLLKKSQLFENRATFLSDALSYYQKWILFSSGRIELIRRFQILGKNYIEIAKGGNRLENIAEAIRYLKLASSISRLIVSVQDQKMNEQDNSLQSFTNKKKNITTKESGNKDLLNTVKTDVISRLPSFMVNQEGFWDDKVDKKTPQVQTEDIDTLNYSSQVKKDNEHHTIKGLLPDLEQYLDFLRTGKNYTEFSIEGDRAMQEEMSLGNFTNGMKILYKEQTNIVNLKLVAFLMRDLGDAFRILNQYMYSVILYENAIKSLLILETIEFLPKSILHKTRKEITQKLNEILAIKYDPTKKIQNPEPIFESESPEFTNQQP